MDIDKTGNAFKEKLDRIKIPEACIKAITEVCSETIPKKRGRRNRRRTYWGNSDIAEKWKASIKATRALIGARKLNRAQAVLQEDYRQKTSNKLLRKARGSRKSL
ncbi:hypothetical protein Zmor_003839 [Zophobas morio]|uniref:Uncharacterized protein n=1 Tax=Zophobas morio TaxID=2755281 RepID=A0AA38HMT7_9CUCU|nr:hypothetical protein Zmor_003839 [Zophobas morio]